MKQTEIDIDVNDVVEHLTEQIKVFARENAILKAQNQALTRLVKLNEFIEDGKED